MCESWLKSVKLVDRWYFLFPWKMCAAVPCCLVWSISWGLCYFSGRSKASSKAGRPGRSERHPHEGTGTTAKRGEAKCVWCMGRGLKGQVGSHLSLCFQGSGVQGLLWGSERDVPRLDTFFLFRVLSPPLECRSRSCSPRSATAFSF